MLYCVKAEKNFSKLRADYAKNVLNIGEGAFSPRLHHPSLGRAELRMACQPYPSKAKGKDGVLHSLGGGGQKTAKKTRFEVMFYTYILRSINHPDHLV